MKKRIFLVGLLAIVGGIAVSSNGRKVNQVNAGEMQTRLMDPEADINYAKAREEYFRENFEYTEEYYNEILAFMDWRDNLPSYSSEAKNYFDNCWGAYCCYTDIDILVDYLESERKNLTSDEYNYAYSIIEELIELFKKDHSSESSRTLGPQYQRKIRDFVETIKKIPETKDKILELIELSDVLKNKEDIEELKENWFFQLDNAKTPSECDAIYDAVAELSSQLYKELELKRVKEKAIKELEDYIDGIDKTDFGESHYALLEKYKNECIDKINNASEENRVLNALAEGKRKISKITVVTKHTREGCGGSVIAAAGVISLVSALGVALISVKKKEN